MWICAVGAETALRIALCAPLGGGFGISESLRISVYRQNRLDVSGYKPRRPTHRRLGSIIALHVDDVLVS